MRERDAAFELALAHELGLPQTVATVLRNRGIATVSEAQEFLNPSMSGLHDPFLLPDMLAAVQRVELAMQRGEQVLIHGDYDADGVTSTALLVRALSKLGLDVHYFIPHRFHDHYGVAQRAVSMATKKKLGLLISVDCGVSDHEMIAQVRAGGTDVIIIDHHQPMMAGDGKLETCPTRNDLPEGALVIDPKRADGEYPFRELSAVGLAYKFIVALSSRRDVPEEFVARAFLDLVAVGTIADVAPLVDENRTLCAAGLKLLSQTRKAGLRALMDICQVNGNLSAMDIAFRIAPRLNAVGRMGDATEALELLLSDDPEEALRLALKLEGLNRQRQAEQERIYQQARRQAEELLADRDYPVLVLSNPQWHLGIVGIVASKILEDYNRPAVIISEEDDLCRGSGRSIAGFDMAQAFAACSDLVVRGGGHALAGGLTLTKERIADVRERLCVLAAETLKPTDLLPCLDLDCEVQPEEIMPELVEALAKLEPYGESNPAPVFLTRALEVLNVRQVGKDGNHLKLTVGHGRRAFDAIGFGMGQSTSWIEVGAEVDLAYTPEFNEYNGNVGMQLRLSGVRQAEG
ncbi:MAG: single-stranded-DNA-specific exonuclease RecJ [Armatimonadota bacterium]